MSYIRIAGETFVLDGAELLAYHCCGPEADWNLALSLPGRTLYLSGTVTPAPRTADDLEGAAARVDLRSLDEVIGDLLGHSVTLYPGGQDVCELTFPLARSPKGVRLAVVFTSDWDRVLETFPGAGDIEIAIEIDAVVSALHPGRHPDLVSPNPLY